MSRVGLYIVLTAAGIMLAAGPVLADGKEGNIGCTPRATTVAFPTINPPGWYTNTYWYNWYYPWYAYYNWSQGPYANWMAARGVATYGYRVPTPPGPLPAQVSIVLPANAKLFFSGIEAVGSGEARVFATPPLEPNQEYGYDMSAEIIKEGKVYRFTKLVIVHAADQVELKLDPSEFKLGPPPAVPVPKMPEAGVPLKK